MKLHIIGKGVVGTATGEGFRKWGHAVVYTDKGDNHGAVAAHLHLVCTPEEVVPAVVRELARRPAEETLVIRSTVPPGTTQKLSDELRRGILHNPEFLLEKTAQEDFLTRPYAVVGVARGEGTGQRRPSETYDTRNLVEAYRPGGVVCHITDSTTSELVKLATNAHLATLISFWNEAAAVARGHDANPYEVARLVGLDARISPYGRVFLESPYGGRCLVKDHRHLIEAGGAKGIPMPLLMAVQTVNVSFGGL